MNEICEYERVRQTEKVNTCIIFARKQNVLLLVIYYKLYSLPDYSRGVQLVLDQSRQETLEMVMHVSKPIHPCFRI